MQGFAHSTLTQRQYIRLVDSSVGYFANAQYDVLFLYVILNDSEESHRRTDGYIFLALVVGYFACAQYDVKIKDISLRSI